MRVVYPSRIGIWRCWCFVEGGKPEDPEKHPRSKTRQTTNSAHIRTGQDRTHAGGERSHHCAIPAPLQCFECKVISRYETEKFVKKIILR